MVQVCSFTHATLIRKQRKIQGKEKELAKPIGLFCSLSHHPPAQATSRSPLHLHCIKQDEETQTNFHLNMNSPLKSPSGQSQESHMANSAWELRWTFPARSRANPHCCPHMACDWAPQVPPCLQLLAQSVARAGPTGLCQQMDLHFFHQVGAGQ